jgi:hypothetical protein
LRTRSSSPLGASAITSDLLIGPIEYVIETLRRGNDSFRNRHPTGRDGGKPGRF